MPKDLISVIMPVWNPDIKQLELSVKSILDQTYSNLELIIIHKKNNKETDYEIERIFNQNRDDHRIKVIENNNSFVGALNLGIKISNGSKIGRMDSDDI